MKKRNLILMLLLAIGLPWVAMAQTVTYPTWSSSTDSYIKEFKVMSGSTTLLDNVSTGTAAQATDYYDSQSFTAEAGEVLTCTISTYAGGTHGFGLWADLDGDGLETSDLIDGTSSYVSPPRTISFTIPASTPAGEYRVRILAAYYTGSVSDPNGSYSAGESEDYKLIVTVPPCPKPTDLVCTAYTATTATLSWTENGTATNWVIQCCESNDFMCGATGMFNVSGTPSITLDQFTPEKTYYARVKAICDEDSDWSNTCEFKPTAAQIVTIGSGSGTNSYLPTNPWYKYSYTQQIYTAAEIDQTGTIKSVSFKGNNAGTRSLVVYMANTTKETFSATTDYIPISEATQVFSGSVTFTANEWKTIDLTGDGFNYDGTNLAIIVDDNTTNYDMGSTDWLTFTTTGNQGLYFYQDASDIDPSSPSAGNKGITTSKNQIQLGILPSSTPKPRNLVVSNITSEGATVTWTAPADNVTGYQYQYKYATTPTWPNTWNSLAANVTHKDLVALAANTLYDFRVRANYAEGDSDPAEIQFTTEATCLPVTNITVSDITPTGAKLAWTPGGSETSWQYICVAHGDTPDWTSELVITSNTHANVPANIYACTGEQPQPNTEYDFYVRANCGGGDYSEAAMLTFRTACGAITSFPINYGFETSEGFPANASTPTVNPFDACWRNEATVQNGSYPTRVWGTSTSIKHTGSQALVLPDKGSNTNFAKTMLVLPEMEFTYADGYIVSFWIYRNGTASYPEGFKLYVSDCDTIGPNAVELGHYSRNYGIAYPDIVTSGWYQYETDPITRTGSVYLIFEGQSYFGNATYVDDITIKEYVVVTADQIVETVNDPETEMTWNEFVSHWNNGDHFTSTTFTLMDNIAINEMVGTSNNPFTGTFDGNGHTITLNYTATENFCAPFRYVRNATIQDLAVGGTINTANQFAGGFVGDCFGNNTLTNCLSNVTINSTKSGDGTHGGFIGRNSGGGTVNLTGCAFTGSLLGTETTSCAGLVGWTENGQYGTSSHTIFTNCVFAPAEVTIGTNSSYTFSRIYSSYNTPVTVTNSYYTQTFGTEQGKLKYDITAETGITVTMVGTATEYNVSGITAYADNSGLLYNGGIIAGEGDQVVLTLSGAAGYEADHGTLVANGDVFTLTMEAYNTTISGVACPVPYNVAVPAANITARSAQVTWMGASDSYTMEYREAITPAIDLNVTYDFEDGIQGWTTIDADGHGDAWSRTTSEGNTGNACMSATYNYSYAHQDYLVSPQIQLGGSLSFYAKQASTTYNDNFRVYISTSGNTEATDFTIELTDGDVTPSTSYTQYTYDLSNYSGTGYVAIVYTAIANQHHLYVDDITITAYAEGEYGEWQTISNAESPQTISNLTPETSYQVRVKGNCGGTETDYSEAVSFTTLEACSTPSEFVLGEVTAHTAAISWNGGNAESWTVFVKKSTETDYPASGDVVNTPAKTLESLDAATTYDVKIVAGCDATKVLEVAEAFTTECDVFTVNLDHSFTEGFEGTTFAPICWESIPYVSGTTTRQWSRSTSASYGYSHTGSGSAYSDYYGPIYLVMPDIQISSEVDGAQLSFWSYNSFTDDYDKNSVVLLNGENETELWSPESVVEDWEETTIDLTAYMGQTIKLAFKYEGYNAHGWYIDDVKVEVLFTKTIEAVGEEGWANGKGGYYFIASPVTEPVTPTADNGFIVGDYDLYYFSQTDDGEGNEWINFKDETLGGYTLTNGKGYLYASKEGTTLTFTGTPGTNGNVTLDTYDGNARFKGWNLIGNPFAQDAYITKDFYTLENGDTYTSNTAGTPIHAMQGVLITAEADETSVAFSTEAPATNDGKLNMNLRRDNKQLDNAILVFGGNQQLGKMTFRANSSKVYMPVEGKDYAITSVEGQVGEVPVSFKAENNGTYSLNFTSEEVSFSYLHLIDNMTGADVDLLANPTYSFDARTSDYESRFRLVFATGSSVDGDSFGFVNESGNFCIFGIEGEATVQVIDILGHVISSETFSGSYEKKINGAPGVYLVRLINGENVKTQKVVVR